MNIQKITNIKSSPSEEKIINSWKQIKSLKIKMLNDTDWIFVKDSNLTESCISAWIKWRDKVKKSKDITNLDEASEYLRALHNNRPELQYASEKPKNVESYKKLLHKALQDTLKTLSENVADEFGSRDVLIEKFEEAVRYKDGSNNYILLEIESEFTNKTLDEVSEIAINNRHIYLTKLIKLERSKHLYTNHIEMVESFEECDKLLDSILMLAGKKWISI